jgi:hypothetical protein
MRGEGAAVKVYAKDVATRGSLMNPLGDMIDGWRVMSLQQITPNVTVLHKGWPVMFILLTLERSNPGIDRPDYKRDWYRANEEVEVTRCLI